jgi:hypothetical protein
VSKRRAPLIAWPVLIAVSGGFFGITALLLWWGAVIAVRCDRVAAGRVDVVAERRLLEIVPVWTERLPDVVKAHSIRRPGGPRRGGQAPVGPQLQLTLRDGREWESMPTAMHIVGTPPAEMAERIQEFLERSSALSLRLRWIPWLMNALAVPFLLISALFVAVWVNMLRRALGWGGPA